MGTSLADVKRLTKWVLLKPLHGDIGGGQTRGDHLGIMIPIVLYLLKKLTSESLKLYYNNIN